MMDPLSPTAGVLPRLLPAALLSALLWGGVAWAVLA
jgi:hypothetical protein